MVKKLKISKWEYVTFLCYLTVFIIKNIVKYQIRCYLFLIPAHLFIQSGLQIKMLVGEVCYTHINWGYIPIFLHFDARIPMPKYHIWL